MGHRGTRLYVENLGGTVAARGYKPAVQAEADAANDALVRQVVDQFHIENTPGTRVEDGEPIGPLLLEIIGK